MYFGLKPPNRNQGMPGFLGNLLHSLMDDDGMSSEFPSEPQTALNQQRAPTSTITGTSQQNNQPVHQTADDDLD